MERAIEQRSPETDNPMTSFEVGIITLKRAWMGICIKFETLRRRGRTIRFLRPLQRRADAVAAGRQAAAERRARHPVAALRLIPAWSQDEAIVARLINARAESVGEKPSFRTAFRRRRCVVPASGFYEWQQIAGEKQPFYVHPVDGEFFGLAGLWERWTRPADGEVLDTFTIVTTDANAAMRPLHDRMPVILAPADYAAWLDGLTPPEQVQALIRPCAEAMLAAHPVRRPSATSATIGRSRFSPSEHFSPRGREHVLTKKSISYETFS